MALKVVNSPLTNGVKKCTSDYKTRNAKRPTHNGMDLISGNSVNNYICAIENGKVTMTNYDSKSGYYIFIQHENGYKSFYCHLKKNTTVVKKGQKVTKGQRIATMGTTGASTGTHLHFAVKNSDKVWIDPKPYLEGTASFKKLTTYTGKYPTIPTRGYFKTGDSGEQVKRLQQLLNWLNNSKLSIDGKVGELTIAEVKTFQKSANIKVDGKYGKTTQATAKKQKRE